MLMYKNKICSDIDNIKKKIDNLKMILSFIEKGSNTLSYSDFSDLKNQNETFDFEKYEPNVKTKKILVK